MFKFIKVPDEDNRFDNTTLEMSFPGGCSLGTMLEEFESFLKASGFIFDGELDFVLDDPPEVETETRVVYTHASDVFSPAKKKKKKKS